MYDMYDLLNNLYLILFLGGVLYYGNILRKIAKKLVENAIIAHDKDLPKFVKMGNNTKDRCVEMRLRYNDDNELEYWRDSGAWGIAFKFKQKGLRRILITDAKHYAGDLETRLEGVKLTPITEKEWFNGNESWDIPDYYKEEFEPTDLSEYGVLKDDELPF